MHELHRRLALPFAIRPLTPSLGAEIRGVDLAEGVGDEAFAAIYQALLRYQVLLFAPQDLPPGRQVEFARRFGEVQIHVMNQYHADGYPELYRLSNLDAERQAERPPPGQGHARVAHRRLVAARHRAGNDHLWRDRPREWWRDALLRHVRRVRAPEPGVEGAPRRHARRAQPGFLAHSPARRRADDGGAAPRARRWISPSCARIRRPAASASILGDHAEYIVGMPYDEGRALIDELNALAVHPDLTYEHHWAPGQLIVWDNRCVMHRATDYDPATQRRVVRRCTVLGEVR